MKKLIVLLTLVLAMFLAAMPVGAAIPSELIPGRKFVKLLDFDSGGITTGMSYPEFLDKKMLMWGLAGPNHPTQYFIVAPGGEEGNALKMGFPSEYTNMSTGYMATMDLSAVGGKTDWTKATDMVFWVDTSEFTYGTVELGITMRILNATKDSTIGWKIYTTPTTFKVYLSPDGRNWSAYKPTMSAERMNFPAGYVGWVRVPLEDSNWRLKNSSDVYTPEAVTSILIFFRCNAVEMEKMLLLDSIGLIENVDANPPEYPMGSNDTTATTTSATTTSSSTTKPATTTKATTTKATTTKAPDSTSGEGDSAENSLNPWLVIGIVAGVAVVGGGVVYIILRQRKKK